MSIARHHAEWLSLLETSGPFLSMPVLMEAFNTGLEPHDPNLSRLLRQEFANWQESFKEPKADPVPHHHWIKFVLTKVLELDDRVLAEGQAIPQPLQVEVPEHYELLRPSIVVVDPTSQKPRLLVQTYPRSQQLTSYVVNSHWKASPDTRMTELLHATGVRLGLVTNGEQWMLVNAPKGETTGYSSWYATLWLEEPITLRAFRVLLSASRFFNVPDEQTLEALLAKSASNQQEVTDQLGYQVRRAVDVLIHSLDRADQDYGRELLADVSPEQLYESALTVMMRLVFLFCAEERELIPSKSFPVYEQNYSVSTISKQLRELADQHGEELLERRYDAWPRLLAAFRAVYGGLRHDDVHILAYGGNLFNPDRFPFLEGRKRATTWRDAEANPLPVNNRTVLHLLEALQLLQIKVPGGGPAEARRLSFRSLDIEQIGHVYEGLLDHTAKRADEPYLGLVGTREKEPEIPLAELEKLLAKGEADLVGFLKDETGKSANAIKKLLKAELDPQHAARFRTACQSDDALWKRVLPLAGLVRQDNFGYPVVIPKNSVYVTEGTDRRSSGTHYTPRSLTEPIVQYTLEPLVFVGPAEGKPKNEWKLKSAKELLELKICDMACGSGAFLVQAARYMAERLMEAWERSEAIAQPGHQENLFDPRPNVGKSTVRMTPLGLASQGGLYEQLIPLDPEERKIFAMRIIVQRCLYGVDKNPLAVEMAKLSLWLLTLAKDKPFEFLDHSIRCGDSLVGLHSLDQLRHYSLKPDADDAVLFKGPLDSAVNEAITLRLKLEDMPANSVEDVQRQEALLIEANEKIARLRCAADLLVAAEFWGECAKDKLERVRHAAVKSGYYVEKGPTAEFEQVAAKECRGQLMFHWPLEFPEVIVKRGGFDAFVGNPPFVGGMRIEPTFGAAFRSYIVEQLADTRTGVRGAADLSCYFLLRAIQLTSTSGAFSLITSATVAQGDARVVALEAFPTKGRAIYRAESSRPWPGMAATHVCIFWISHSSIRIQPVLDGVPVNAISSGLSAEMDLEAAHVLSNNGDVAFEGAKTAGMGFVISQEDALRLLSSDNRNREVVKRYMGGEDANTHPRCEPCRWIINFRDMPLLHDDKSPKAPCAADYPECLSIIEERVKPERLALEGRTAQQRNIKQRWWQFYLWRPALAEAIKELSRVIVTSRVTAHHNFCFAPVDIVYSDRLVVIAKEDWSTFAILSSTLHGDWAHRPGATTQGSTLNYFPTWAFLTFPFPSSSNSLNEVGEMYHEARMKVMIQRYIGLTKIYNRFHDPDEISADIQKLRDLHAEMDQAVAAAYGWTDLELGHGFYETKQGVRFTISEAARREVLARLLTLNHERYNDEVKQGLHGKKKAAPKKKAPKNSAKQEADLFDEGDDE